VANSGNSKCGLAYYRLRRSECQDFQRHSPAEAAPHLKPSFRCLLPMNSKKAGELAAQRVSNFDPHIDGALQCPRCWIEDGRRLRIAIVPSKAVPSKALGPLKELLGHLKRITALPAITRNHWLIRWRECPCLGQQLPLTLDNTLKRVLMFAGKRDHLRRLSLSYFMRVSPALSRSFIVNA
jgi:hypothetical protein